MRQCFYCEKDIEIGEGRIVPLDRPYINLWAHRATCADAMDKEYLTKNIDRIYALVDQQHDIKNKKEKRRK